MGLGLLRVCDLGLLSAILFRVWEGKLIPFLSTKEFLFSEDLNSAILLRFGSSSSLFVCVKNLALRFDRPNDDCQTWSREFCFTNFGFIFKSLSSGSDQPPKVNKDQMMNTSHPGIVNQRQNRNLYQIYEPQSICMGQVIGNGRRHFSLNPGVVKYSDMISSQFQPQFDGKKNFPYSSQSYCLTNRNNFLKPVYPKLKRTNHKRRSWKGRKLMQKPQGKAYRTIDQFLPKTCVKGLMKGEQYEKFSVREFPCHNGFKPHKSELKMDFMERYAHPHAPLNTSSIIIQGNGVGGMSTPVSPAYELHSSSLSPSKLWQSRELFEDMAKDEFGVECYGSMQGLIRFWPEERKKEADEVEEEMDSGDRCGLRSDFSDEHLGIKRRLDQYLSQFEFVNLDYEARNKSILANRVEDQNSYIGELEDENFALREKVFLVKRELDDMRRNSQFLEKGQEDVGDEISDCSSDNEIV